MMQRGTGEDFLKAVKEGRHVSRRVDGALLPVMWAEERHGEIVYAVAFTRTMDTMVLTANRAGLMEWGEWKDD
jgi:hypothetical protein